MVAGIFAERNAERPSSATFAHFVEVCGMMTPFARGKAKDPRTFEDGLCKALGWYFPLMAKLGVRSLEALIFRKYPYACPYCGKCPHYDPDCKQARKSIREVNPQLVLRLQAENAARRPKTLNEWQLMFSEIYPRAVGDDVRSTLGLMEELGELAEAMRVFERYPKYFAGEAADVFSYIMGLANEHAVRETQQDREFSFEEVFLRRYPGLCVQCGYQVCCCPAIPDATVGRLAKELDLGASESLFNRSPSVAEASAKQASEAVLDRLGGYTSVAAQFPFDRGDTNRTLVVLCLRLADLVSESRPQVAERLQRAAIRVSETATYSGSRSRNDEVSELASILADVWPSIGEVSMHGDQALAGQVRTLLTKETVERVCRIGIVTALPLEFAAMKAMLDSPTDYRAEHDPNDCIVGTIPSRDGRSVHTIAVTLLKAMGNNSAAASASHLLRSFPKVEDVLMVGICGAIPTFTEASTHVRLGDIVILDQRGILQYDHVTVATDNPPTLRAPNKSPSARLLGRARVLQSEGYEGRHPWEQLISRASHLTNAARPPEQSDILHRADGSIVEHPSDPDRRLNLPRVHQGGIGSANVLLRDGAWRDQLGAAHELRGVEMEGSGIADGTWIAGQGYLVVRGACDYCDKWKNKEWQGYAAVVAAAYARALIESLPTVVSP